MIHRLVVGFSVTLLFLLMICLSTIVLIDRETYRSKPFYSEMQERLDSLEEKYLPIVGLETAMLGWSKTSIPIVSNQPLAGYGARNPKALTSIHDSLYIKIYVIKKGDKRVAVITADLLIIHPELKKSIISALPEGWKKEELYFTATHTHSSIGGWAPGLVGQLFAGSFDENILHQLSISFVKGLSKAEKNLDSGLLGYSKFSVHDLVYNRLAKEKGIVDPWFHLISLITPSKKSLITSFSAHATCLGRSNHEASGDYPTRLMNKLRQTSNYDLVGFMAGAVGSMGPSIEGSDGWDKSENLASKLKDQCDLIELIGLPYEQIKSLTSFKLKLSVGSPYFKISKKLALRPYLFNYFFGEYQPEISVLKINNLLFLGMPCDFSGELAIPLYDRAAELGLNLIITSFNGDYLGYVIKDEWYELDKYEPRTMSWYGPEMGAYMTEVSNRIIEIVHEN